MKRLSIICLFLLAWAGTLFAQTLKSKRVNWDSAYALIINSTGISQSPTRRLRKATRLGNLYGVNTMKSMTTTTNCLWQ